MSPNSNEKSCDSPSFFAAACCLEVVRQSPLLVAQQQQPLSPEQVQKTKQEQQRLETIYSESFLKPMLRKMLPEQNVASFIASGSSASNSLVKDLEGVKIPHKEFFKTFSSGSFLMRPTISKFEKGSMSVADSKTKIVALLNETTKRHGLDFLLQNLIVVRDGASWLPAGFLRASIPINHGGFVSNASKEQKTKDLMSNLITDVLMFAFEQRFKDEKEFAPSKAVCEVLQTKLMHTLHFALQTVFTLEDGSKHEMMFNLFAFPESKDIASTTCYKIKELLDEIIKVTDFFKSRNKKVLYFDINLIDVFFPYSLISEHFVGDNHLDCVAKFSPQHASEHLMEKFISSNLPAQRGIFPDSGQLPLSQINIAPFVIPQNSSIDFGQGVVLQHNRLLDTTIANNFIARAVREHFASFSFEEKYNQSLSLDKETLVKDIVDMGNVFADNVFEQFKKNFPATETISNKEIKIRFIIAFVNFFLANVKEEAKKKNRKVSLFTNSKDLENLKNEIVVNAFKLLTDLERI